MSVTYYVSGKAKKLYTLPEIIRKETISGIRRGQQRIRRAAAEGLRLRSIGRAIFGTKVSGAYKNLKRERVVERGGVFVAGIKANGVAAIQDQGLAIKPHLIKRRGHEWGNGTDFVARSVTSAFMHPGVQRMPAFPFLSNSARSQEGAFRTEIERGMARVAAAVNG